MLHASIAYLKKKHINFGHSNSKLKRLLLPKIFSMINFYINNSKVNSKFFQIEIEIFKNFLQNTYQFLIEIISTIALLKLKSKNQKIDF